MIFLLRLAEKMTDEIFVKLRFEYFEKKSPRNASSIMSQRFLISSDSDDDFDLTSRRDACENNEIKVFSIK